MSEWRSGSIGVEVSGLSGERLPVSFIERPGTDDGACSAAGGAPVLYLHGLGSSGRDFEPAASAPELAGYRLIAVDLPGSGETAVPGRPVMEIDDLAELVDVVLAELAPGGVHLIGHSMGGLVGLLVASGNPAGVASFVDVEGNLAPIDCRVFSRRVDELAATTASDEIVEVLADELSRSGRAGYATFARRFRSEVRPEAFVRYCRSIVEVADREPLLERFLDLAVPRMFVYGEANRDLPYLPGLRHGGIEVEEIPASDHFPIYSNPRRFFAVAGEFVRRHHRGGANCD